MRRPFSIELLQCKYAGQCEHSLNGCLFDGYRHVRNVGRMLVACIVQLQGEQAASSAVVAYDHVTVDGD